MASERQIAANRRNARNSTGPRSQRGKKRVGRNACKHGLSATGSSEKFVRAVDKLARKILAGSDSAVALDHARSAAEASLYLARVRHIKVALIEYVVAFGNLDQMTWRCLKRMGLQVGRTQ